MLENLKTFLVEVWREVRPTKGRVTWPSAASVRVSTVVVILSSIFLAAFIFLCDIILRTGMKQLMAA
jgi:preprotein translocase SecE subunit